MLLLAVGSLITVDNKVGKAYWNGKWWRHFVAIGFACTLTVVVARWSATRISSRSASRPASSTGGEPAPGTKGFRMESMQSSVYSDV